MNSINRIPEPVIHISVPVVQEKMARSESNTAHQPDTVSLSRSTRRDTKHKSSCIKDDFSANSAELETKKTGRFPINLEKFKDGVFKAIDIAGIIAENLIYALGGGMVGAACFGYLASCGSIALPVAMEIGAVVGAGANIALNSKKYVNLSEEIGEKAGKATGNFLSHGTKIPAKAAHVFVKGMEQAQEALVAGTKIPAKATHVFVKGMEQTQEALVAGTKVPAKIANEISNMSDAVSGMGPRIIEATIQKFIIEPVEIAAFTTTKLKEALSAHKGADKA